MLTKLSKKTVQRLQTPAFIQAVETVNKMRREGTTLLLIDQVLFGVEREDGELGPAKQLLSTKAGRIVTSCMS